MIFCKRHDTKMCSVCRHRFDCDIPNGREPKHHDEKLKVDSVLNRSSDNPISNRAVCDAIETLQFENNKNTNSLSEQLANIPVERGIGNNSVQLKDPNRKAGTGANGTRSTAFGADTIASVANSHAEGKETQANGDNSHAEGYKSVVSGANSHAEGKETQANGDNSHAEGNITTASGDESHSEGYFTHATARQSHAEGSTTWATGLHSHAEGDHSCAYGRDSHAEGNYTKAGVDGGNADLSKAAHAEGIETEAIGIASHAEGNHTKAIGNYSHAEGNCTEAKNDGEHASGMYNKSNYKDENAQTIFSIGIGTSDTDRKNAIEVLRDGRVFIKGIGGYDGTNPFDCKFGGIVCLTLGDSMETAKAEKIIQVLQDILTNQKHYILTIYDTVEGKFFGDCEVVQEGTNSVNIISNYISTTLSGYTIYYSFKTDTKAYKRNKYSVSIATKGSVDTLKNTIEALEARIAALEGA